MQHFIKRYSRYSRYRTKSHDKATISHDITRYSRYLTALLKLQEIISTLSNTKMLCLCRAFFVISWRTMNCPYGHELAYAMNFTIVHELPTALKEWAIQFMKSQISNHEAARLQFMTACRQFIIFCRHVYFW